MGIVYQGGFSTATVRLLERNWRGMVRIAHDFFHIWRRVVAESQGDELAWELELAFWERLGEITAQVYLERNMVDPQDMVSIVRALARSSEVMGEQVRIENEGRDWLLIHENCPWPLSYQQYGGAMSCRPGCDRWFAATVARLNSGVSVRTEAAIPNGDTRCVRRFRWNL